MLKNSLLMVVLVTGSTTAMADSVTLPNSQYGSNAISVDKNIQKSLNTLNERAHKIESGGDLGSHINKLVEAKNNVYYPTLSKNANNDHKVKIIHLDPPNFNAGANSFDFRVSAESAKGRALLAYLNATKNEAINNPTHENMSTYIDLRKSVESALIPVKKLPLSEKYQTGIYDGVSKGTCNYSHNCNKILQTANAIYHAQTMGSDQEIKSEHDIISNSKTYVFNLALLATSKDVYRVMQDSKNDAYQKAQLAMLTDIDSQLREVNKKLQAN